MQQKHSQDTADVQDLPLRECQTKTGRAQCMRISLMIAAMRASDRKKPRGADQALQWLETGKRKTWHTRQRCFLCRTRISLNIIMLCFETCHNKETKACFTLPACSRRHRSAVLLSSSNCSAIIETSEALIFTAASCLSLQHTGLQIQQTCNCTLVHIAFHPIGRTLLDAVIFCEHEIDECHQLSAYVDDGFCSNKCIQMTSCQLLMVTLMRGPTQYQKLWVVA